MDVNVGRVDVSRKRTASDGPAEGRDAAGEKTVEFGAGLAAAGQHGFGRVPENRIGGELRGHAEPHADNRGEVRRLRVHGLGQRGNSRLRSPGSGLTE